MGGLAHAPGLDHCQLAIEDTIKDISRTLSGHADIDFHPDAVHLTPSLHRRLRQHTGLFDERCNRRRQLGHSRDDARPILNRKPLRQGASGYDKQRYQKTHDREPKFAQCIHTQTPRRRQRLEIASGTSGP